MHSCKFVTQIGLGGRQLEKKACQKTRMLKSGMVSMIWKWQNVAVNQWTILGAAQIALG